MNTGPTSTSARRFWDDFCLRHRILEDCIRLFLTDDNLVVQVKDYGKAENRRKVLCRSPEMEHLVRASVATLIKDRSIEGGSLDGLIYMMGYRRANHFEPLYIGKAETVGRNGGLSANIEGIKGSPGKFARWGDGYAYHIGDLSACVLKHAKNKQLPKYKKWAERLFLPDSTRLREQVYFWAMPWDHRQEGIWRELGPTNLALLEYLLIGVAGLIFEDLLNSEGKNRFTTR